MYFAKKKVAKINSKLRELNYELTKDNLTKNVSKSYYKIVYLNQKKIHLEAIDSLYRNFSKAAKRKFELGESNYLEMITSQSKHRQFTMQLEQLNNDIKIAHEELMILLQSEDKFKISENRLSKIIIEDLDFETHLINRYYIENSKYYKAKKSVEKQRLLPDLQFNYFNSKDLAINTSVSSFQLGVSIPIFFFEKSAKIGAAKIEEDIANEIIIDSNLKLKSKYKNLLEELKKSEAQLNYYEESGEKLGSEILKTATISYINGEIDFFQYIQSIETSSEVRINHLNNMNAYNQIAIELNYLNL